MFNCALVKLVFPTQAEADVAVLWVSLVQWNEGVWAQAETWSQVSKLGANPIWVATKKDAHLGRRNIKNVANTENRGWGI